MRAMKSLTKKTLRASTVQSCSLSQVISMLHMHTKICMPFSMSLHMVTSQMSQIQHIVNIWHSKPYEMLSGCGEQRMSLWRTRATLMGVFVSLFKVCFSFIYRYECFKTLSYMFIYFLLLLLYGSFTSFYTDYSDRLGS